MKSVFRFTASGIAAALMLTAMPAVPQVSAAGTTLTVGPNGTYKTVGAAVQAAASLNPNSEANRVTISIAPGTYREQLQINTPYLSFVNSNPSGGEVLITWYYGIGYKYYSSASSGYYKASDAQSKSAKGVAQRWGTAVRLQSGAKYFRAENITFENSFNRYITDEEIADGVEATGETLTVQRKKGLDVKAKSATERAAAMCTEADGCEFYKCTFLSSQDTLYTSNSAYFRECVISGNTDYIFGSGNIVFDRCELRFAGYTDNAVGGYITAAREQTLGYLFWECNVTAASGMKAGAGYFGRPWRDTAHVLFYNTTLQSESLIQSAGWTKMSGVEPSQATFREYGTVNASGGRVNTSGRVSGTVLSSCNATREQYFGNWTPCYYNFSGSGSTLKQAADFIESQRFRLRNVNSGLYLSADASGNAVQSSRADALIFVNNPVFEEQNQYNTFTAESGGALSLDTGSGTNGEKIVVRSGGDRESLFFKLVYAGGGSYMLTAKRSEDAACIGVSGGAKEAGAPAILWECNGEKDQQWIPEFEGRFITGLRVLDEEHLGSWTMMRHVQDGVLVYGDRDVTFANLPAELIDSESVTAACDAKYTAGDLASFTASTDVTVYVGMDTRVSPLPAWLSGWSETALRFQNSSGVEYLCYAKDFSAGESVTLGTNGQSASCVNYAVFIAEKPQETTTTTTTTTTTETTTTTTETTTATEETTTTTAEASTASSDTPQRALKGDADCDGYVDLSDAVLLAKATAGVGDGLSVQGMRNADCDGTAGIDGGDLRILLLYLCGAIDSLP